MKKKSLLAALLLAVTAATAQLPSNQKALSAEQLPSIQNASSAEQLPYQNAALSAHERALDLCSRLTLEEKSQLMRNGSPAIKRLGIPQFDWWSEALHGVARNGFATVFPQTTAMAASWDDQLLYRIFQAISDEAVAKNNLARQSGRIGKYQGLSIWTPNINIFRDPRWGRGQETYGEDPFLTTRMGMAVVDGLQGQPYQGDLQPLTERPQLYKTLACAKHFLVHSGPEWSRHVFNLENLPQRDLWETYMPAFKALIQLGNVREVMCAYHRMDGQPCCGNSQLMTHLLREELGFDGLAVSDCGAIADFFREGRHHVVDTPEEASAQAVGAGTDVECGAVYAALPKAVREGRISEAKIDSSVVRLLTERFMVGDFDGPDLVPWKNLSASCIASPEHKQLALQMARESIVLLQNRNATLPLQPTGDIVVMGPNATDSVMLWANYNGYPTATTTILKGIHKYAPQARLVEGCGYTRNEIFQSRFDCFTTPDGQPGMRATYWNNQLLQGEPAVTTVLREGINLSNGGNTVFAPGVELENFSAAFEGSFTPKQTEELCVSLSSDDCGRVIINGDTIINAWKGRERVNVSERNYTFEAGRQYSVRVEYSQNVAMAVCKFDIALRQPTTAEAIAQQAKGARAVIFAGGISPRLEGEEMSVKEPGFRGGDRTSIELPEAQREVVRLLSEQGTPVIFLNCSGGAIALTPEADRCPALVQAWYGGEAGGEAVADVLFGTCNPSGKLPLTFYRSDADLPDFEDYTMQNRTYRYFTGQPLYAFGHGLSYTTFRLGRPAYKNGQLTLTVTNTGQREGTETVQVYVKDPTDTAGPTKTLRGYQRVTLQPGQTETVSIAMPRERFELWDAATNTMRTRPGRYQLLIGTSSDDPQMQTVSVKIK